MKIYKVTHKFAFKLSIYDIMKEIVKEPQNLHLNYTPLSLRKCEVTLT